MQGWTIHRNKKGITTKDYAAYEKAYNEFLMSCHKTQFKTWLLYDKTKVIYHALSNNRMLDTFKPVLSSHTDFLHPELNPERAIYVMHDIVTAIINKLEQFMPHDVLRIVVLEALKFAVIASDVVWQVDTTVGLWRLDVNSLNRF